MIREIPHRDGGGFFFPPNPGVGGFTPTHGCRKPSVADRTTSSNNAKQAGIFSNSIPTVSHRQQKADLSSAKRSAFFYPVLISFVNLLNISYNRHVIRLLNKKNTLHVARVLVVCYLLLLSAKFWIFKIFHYLCNGIQIEIVHLSESPSLLAY